MNAQPGIQVGVTPLAILGFVWSFLAPVLSETQLSTVLGALSQESASATLFGTWIARHVEVLRFGLWGLGLLSVVVAALCIVSRASVYASTKAALATSLLSGSTVFLTLFLSTFALMQGYSEAASLALQEAQFAEEREFTKYERTTLIHITGGSPKTRAVVVE